MAERSCLISLSLSLSFSLFLYLSLIIYLPTYWSICLSLCLSIYLSVCLSVCLSIYLSIYLSICVCAYAYIHTSCFNGPIQDWLLRNGCCFLMGRVTTDRHWPHWPRFQKINLGRKFESCAMHLEKQHFAIAIKFQPLLIPHWLVVWNIWIIFPYIGKNRPNWRTHIFQRGWNHQLAQNEEDPTLTWRFQRGVEDLGPTMGSPPLAGSKSLSSLAG